MGDVLYGIDFKNKKRLEPIPTPLDEGLAIIAIALNMSSIDDIPWPGMDSANYVAPEKDPA